MFVKMLQDYIFQAMDATGLDLGVADNTGSIVACSNEGRFKNIVSLIHDFLLSDAPSSVAHGIAMQKAAVGDKSDYVVFIESDDDSSLKLLSLISVNIAALRAGYDEKFDKVAFIKGILAGDIAHSLILERAKELHISLNIPRVVYVIKALGEKNTSIHEIVHGLFPNRLKDFTAILDREHVALVKELKPNEDSQAIEKTARVIADTLSTELMAKVYVGIGTVAGSLEDIGKSCEEAWTSLLIGGIFFDERYVFSYNNLGPGRLIYRLSDSCSRLFLSEYFKDGAFDFTDTEIMLTIQKFFENSLNISETSRQLFVHRNTLVYRLDKVQKLTGLDLRNFDDAITFKLAMMVKRYLDKGGSLKGNFPDFKCSLKETRGIGDAL